MERYTVVKKIGQGSFGTAILCRAKRSGQYVVIKRVDMHDMPEEERRAATKGGHMSPEPSRTFIDSETIPHRACAEATILAHLKHPCIIRHLESFEDTGVLCIVTEFAERGDLAARLEARKGAVLAESQVLEWFTQLCLALYYMHKRKVLHRDLKLQNVFITADNEVRLGDFGIARVLKHTMECARTVVGTPYYLSPEICENRPYNHKSDVWSLGCILYELCALRHAFDAGSITALVRKILKGRFDPIPPSFSSNVSTLIDAMLQLRPSHRPSLGSILSLPFLRPYIDAYAKKCGAKGVVVPHAEMFLSDSITAVPAPISLLAVGDAARDLRQRLGMKGDAEPRATALVPTPRSVLGVASGHQHPAAAEMHIIPRKPSTTEAQEKAGAGPAHVRASPGLARYISPLKRLVQASSGDVKPPPAPATPLGLGPNRAVAMSGPTIPSPDPGRPADVHGAARTPHRFVAAADNPRPRLLTAAKPPTAPDARVHKHAEGYGVDVAIAPLRHEPAPHTSTAGTAPASSAEYDHRSRLHHGSQLSAGGAVHNPVSGVVPVGRSSRGSGASTPRTSRDGHPGTSARTPSRPTEAVRGAGAIETGAAIHKPAAFRAALLQDPNFVSPVVNLCSVPATLDDVSARAGRRVPDPPSPRTRVLSTANIVHASKAVAGRETEAAGDSVLTPHSEQQDKSLMEEADALLPHGLALHHYRAATIRTLRKQTGPMVARPGGDAVHASKDMTADELASPVHEKITVNGATLHLPRATYRDPLTFRIEVLRVYLADVLGGAELVSLYKRIQSARGADTSSQRLRELVFELVPNVITDDIPVRPLLFQLIHLEDSAFKH